MPDTTEHHCSFDHLIHIVNDLETAMAAYDDLDLPTHATLSMPGFRNAAWAIEASRTPGPVSFAVHVPDAQAMAASLRDAGYQVSVCDIRFDDQIDGQDAGFTEVFVTDAPALFPFFISYSPPREVIARMRSEHRVEQGGDAEPPSTHGPDLVALLAHSNTPSDDARLLSDLLGGELRGTTVAPTGADVHFKQTPSPDTIPGLYGFTVRRAGLTESPAIVAGATVTSATGQG